MSTEKKEETRQTDLDERTQRAQERAKALLSRAEEKMEELSDLLREIRELLPETGLSSLPEESEKESEYERAKREYYKNKERHDRLYEEKFGKGDQTTEDDE